MARLYDRAEWEELRLDWLRDNPLCAMCIAKGYVEAATVVDHVKPHDGDPELFFDRANLQSLCKVCHDQDKQLIEVHGFRPGHGRDGRPIDPSHPWNGGGGPPARSGGVDRRWAQRPGWARPR